MDTEAQENQLLKIHCLKRVGRRWEGVGGEEERGRGRGGRSGRRGEREIRRDEGRMIGREAREKE